MLGAVMAAIRNNDPVAFLDEAAVCALARGLCNDGVRFSPPVLGSERHCFELIHYNRQCPKCGSELRPRLDKGTSAKILHTSGMLEKRHIPLRCRTSSCQLTGAYIWHNYVSKDGKHMLCGSVSDMRCFMVSSSFGCTMDWLRQFQLRLLREHVSFIGEAYVAREFVGDADAAAAPLARLRLNIADAWFKWRIALRLSAIHGPSGIGKLDIRKSAEKCAEEFWEEAHEHFHQSTASKARQRGESCSVAVMDANAKNRRLSCAAVFQHRLRNRSLSKSVRVPCSKTPKLGSLFCADHQEWHDVCASGAAAVEIVAHRKDEALIDSDDSGVLLQIKTPSEEPENWVREDDVHPQIAFEYYKACGEKTLQAAAKKKCAVRRRSIAWKNYVERALSDLAPMWDSLSPDERVETMRLHSAEADLNAVGCSTHKEGEDCKSKCKHTAGVMCACLSSGVIIAVQECFGAESLSQRYLFLAALKERYPELTVIVHDDACHLHKFTDARKADSDLAAKIAPPLMRFICDWFHIKGHTDPWCLVTTHPKIAANAELVAGIRTSVCEFTFTWLSQYKHATKHMSEFTFRWFLLEVIDAHNDRVAAGRVDHLRA